MFPSGLLANAACAESSNVQRMEEGGNLASNEGKKEFQMSAEDFPALQNAEDTTALQLFSAPQGSSAKDFGPIGSLLPLNRQRSFPAHSSGSLLEMIVSMRGPQNPKAMHCNKGYDPHALVSNLATKDNFRIDIPFSPLDESQGSPAKQGSNLKDVSSPYYIKKTLPEIDMENYCDDLLFYIFYHFPRDERQMRAANELFRRGWRFHMGRQLWLFPLTTKLNSYDCQSKLIRGMFEVFDPSRWTKQTEDLVVESWLMEDEMLEKEIDYVNGYESL